MTTGRKGIRGGSRIPVELPVTIRWKTQAGLERRVQGKTENMSGTGLFVVTSVRLRNDTPIQLTVALPTEITKTPVRLHCVGRVMHQHRTRAVSGFGVVIDNYHLAAAARPA